MAKYKISYTVNGAPRSKAVSAESDGEAWELAEEIADQFDDCEIISVVEQ